MLAWWTGGVQVYLGWCTRVGIQGVQMAIKASKGKTLGIRGTKAQVTVSPGREAPDQDRSRELPGTALGHCPRVTWPS